MGKSGGMTALDGCLASGQFYVRVQGIPTQRKRWRSRMAEEHYEITMVSENRTRTFVRYVKSLPAALRAAVNSFEEEEHKPAVIEIRNKKGY